VHSFCALPTEANSDWVLSTTDYGQKFISSVRNGNIYATQFHPEKSGAAGLQILNDFVDPLSTSERQQPQTADPRGLARRVIACLDVRANDRGDLVVTKGDQYDVREDSADASGNREVRNLGLPVELAERYFKEGADEVTFLNITGFRDFPLNDTPMLDVLQASSKNVFVPLTVGGGIREFTDSNGRYYSALEVAAQYFRSGADKVSIGSDAVTAAEEYYASGVGLRHHIASCPLPLPTCTSAWVVCPLPPPPYCLSSLNCIASPCCARTGKMPQARRDGGERKRLLSHVQCTESHGSVTRF